MSSQGTTTGLPVPNSSKSFWHTQPSPLLTGHRSTRELPKEADVVIIGSGITGASAAWHLLSPEARDEVDQPSNLKVVMLEAREACWGATGRNGGHCQPIFFEHPNDPSIGSFELKNFEDIHSLIQRLDIPCEFVVQPGCRAIYSQHHLDVVRKALQIVETRAPEQHKRMTLVTDKARLAELRIPTATAAVVTDIAARLWPYKFVSYLLEHLISSPNALRNNGTFNLQTLTPAESISRSPTSQTWTVRTPRGPITAPKIILATNAYTPHLLPAFTPLIVPCRGQMSALVPPATISGPNRLQTSLGFLGDGEDDYLIQRPSESGGHLMFGGGRHAGAESLGTIDDSVVDASTAKYLRTRLVEALALREREKDEKEGHEKLEELEVVAMWTGIMGFSRDEHPWVGAVPGRYLPGGGEGDGAGDQGVYVAAGYTGHGMPNTWLCGKAIAMMIAGSLRGDNVLEAVKHKVGLPDSYLVSEERIKRAMEEESVEAKDLAERQRGAVSET